MTCKWKELSNTWLTGATFTLSNQNLHSNIDDSKAACSMFPLRFCKGITLQTTDNQYNWRIGDKEMHSGSGETSYTRYDCQEEVVHTKARSLKINVGDKNVNDFH